MFSDAKFSCGLANVMHSSQAARRTRSPDSGMHAYAAMILDACATDLQTYIRLYIRNAAMGALP